MKNTRLLLTLAVALSCRTFCTAGERPLPISSPEHDGYRRTVQDTLSARQREDSVVAEGVAAVSAKIEQSILAGDAKGVARYFGKQVFLSLEGNEGAYYSSNQAQSILADFFDTHSIVAFKFTTVNAAATSSYATGGGIVRERGNRKPMQVYISLALADHRWVISQFNVY